MKLEEVKKLQYVFKSNINKISKKRKKSDEKKMTLENIQFLYKSGQAVIKLFNEYSSILS